MSEDKVVEVMLPCRLCDATFVMVDENGLTWDVINIKFAHDNWQQLDYLDYRCPEHRRDNG